MSLREVAGVRSRGLGPCLFAPAARGRNDQVEPAEDHRGWHGLALPQRTEEGVEGIACRARGGWHEERKDRALEPTGFRAQAGAGWDSRSRWPPIRARRRGASAGDDEAQD